MSVMTVDRPDSRFGSLFMSDSTGQFFSLKNRHINIINMKRSGGGDESPADFERMPGIDGVSLLNEVMNPDQASLGHKKLLRTMITMDNGRSWRPLKAPSVDVNGKVFDCTVTTHINLFYFYIQTTLGLQKSVPSNLSYSLSFSY